MVPGHGSPSEGVFAEGVFAEGVLLKVLLAVATAATDLTLTENLSRRNGVCQEEC
jgi:hypothetical protein